MNSPLLSKLDLPRSVGLKADLPPINTATKVDFWSCLVEKLACF